MRISPMNIVVGVAAGGVDEVLEELDVRAVRTEPFKNWTDWGRVAMTAIGYVGQGFNLFPRITAPLAQSSVTLLTKSIGRVVRNQMAPTIPGMVSHPRSRVIARVRGAMPIGQTPGPGFEDTRTY